MRKVNQLIPLVLLGLILAPRSAGLQGIRAGSEVRILDTGYTYYGAWLASGSVRPGFWEPGANLELDITLRVDDSHIQRIADEMRISADGFCLLVTAERTFDADGRFRQVNDEKMSTLLTPTGLAIEGGIQGACTNRFGYDFRTPFDEFKTLSFENCEKIDAARLARFRVSSPLPGDLPPGIYRLRLDFGITARNKNYSLNAETFAARPFPKGRAPESHIYSAPIRADGTHANGTPIDAAGIRARVPWIILSDYNSNGYRGVVTDEDRPFFALSNRNLIPDDVILPRYDDAGKAITYSLEPRFPADAIEERSNIPWNFASGELEISIVQPDGTIVALGKLPFTGNKGSSPTTGSSAFTAWKPPAYGRYTVRSSGWISDLWGNVYDGGGTYHFWIARRMTLATATFQGMAYPVGGRYGRDLAFNPPVPADVQVDAALYVDSDPANAVTLSFKGKASPGGIFGTAQGNQPLPLGSQGEYAAHILATYTDSESHLWVCSMRHAGIVYPTDSTIVAHGKKLVIGGKYLDRGETRLEGYAIPGTDTSFLQHITFPYYSGDVLLIASEGQGANKIEPVLTYEDKTRNDPYNTGMNGVGQTNLKIRTSNGLSPHMFPEYITEWNYFYAAAPRPGFMSRFIIGDNALRAPYWPTSPNSFGGQIGASANGDLPGDIYRLIGGIVMMKKGEAPRYAGYLSSGFLLPKGTNNNRIVAAGAEDVIGPTGERARFFLVGLRPGMVYETGAAWAPALQIDPVLPVTIRASLAYPDGRTMSWQGTADAFGSYAGSNRATLDVPGVYRYFLEGEWQGFRSVMPGLPANGGEFYVVEKERSAAVPVLTLNVNGQSAFNPSKPLTITGRTTATTVHYAMIIPGAVIEEGQITPQGGIFSFAFDPVAIHQKAPIYDIVNIVNGKTELGKVVHLTFFAKETASTGEVGHSFARLIFRGSKLFFARQ